MRCKMDIATARVLSLKELRDAFRSYLQNDNIEKNTIQTTCTDSFYLWRNAGSNIFWQVITSENFENATQRIPVWALKPNQYNHKIIRAYFMAVEIDEKATITMMEHLCSDIEHSELYVPTFRNNYSQMKLEGPKSHGKVFEDDGENVWIWSEVEAVIMKYKNSFCN